MGRILGLDRIAQDHAGKSVGAGEMVVRQLGESSSLVHPSPSVLDV